MNPNYLDFEQPIAELEGKIEELQLIGNDNDLNITDEIERLKDKNKKLTASLYSNLTPWQVVKVARHPQRPYTTDYISRIFDEWEELHGDRHFGDDAAIVGGVARLNDKPVMIIGEEKGRSVPDKVRRNFGMPRPEGYRKALRLMEMAERFKMPVITLIDTPGAYPGIDSEERGISEAIAQNLAVMSRLRTPIICTVIGEGDKAPQAAEAMGVTSQVLLDLGIVDEIIPEPLGGAHRDIDSMAAGLKARLIAQVDELLEQPIEVVVERRYQRLMSYGN
jgi:acetyl-CoA carboxylase carboxyl transferase subunit alpha